MPLDNSLVPTGRTEAVVCLSLEFDKVAPGKYRLRIEISEPDSAQAARLETDVEFR